VVQDYITGLKALLYTNGRGGGPGQRKPRDRTPALVKDAIDLSDDYDLVATDSGRDVQTFGPYLRDKRRFLAAKAAAAETFGARDGTETGWTRTVPAPTPGTTPPPDGATPVERAVGCGLKAVGAYKSLDVHAQVIALVNEVGDRQRAVPILTG